MTNKLMKAWNWQRLSPKGHFPSKRITTVIGITNTAESKSLTAKAVM